MSEENAFNDGTIIQVLLLILWAASMKHWVQPPSPSLRAASAFLHCDSFRSPQDTFIVLLNLQSIISCTMLWPCIPRIFLDVVHWTSPSALEQILTQARKIYFEEAPNKLEFLPFAIPLGISIPVAFHSSLKALSSLRKNLAALFWYYPQVENWLMFLFPWYRVFKRLSHASPLEKQLLVPGLWM